MKQIGCKKIDQILNKSFILDIPVLSNVNYNIKNYKKRTENLIPQLKETSLESQLLQYSETNLKRCTKCILPETMPFISFDSDGVCNYCHNYTIRNRPKPKDELMKILNPYRNNKGLECIVPFSGGRDSCFGLHLVVNEFKLRPVTYTYD